MENTMKKNYKLKLVALVFCLALVIAGIVGTTVSAESADANAAIKTVTLNYGAELRLAYVYEVSGIEPADVELRISYNADLSEYKATSYTGDVYSGYPMYYSTGISAKDIADTIYVAPYYNGEQIGDVVAYSVLNYCYDVLYGESTKNVEDLVDLANELIEYGAAAQKRLINIGNIPAEALISDYIYVYTADKSITINGRRSAIVAPGAEVAISSATAGGYVVTYENGDSETLSGSELCFAPTAIACIEAVAPAPVVRFDDLETGAAWAEDMATDANIKLLETTTANATVKEENGNKYLEYDKYSTSKRGGLRITKTLETLADEAVMFQANVRFNSLSVTDNRAYFRFYNASLKEISLGSSYYFTVNADGNVTLGGVDTGVAADEWFALTFKFTTNKLEVLVNGKLLGTFNVTDIQTTTEVRLYSDATMLHKTDLDDIYYGVYDESIVAKEKPAEPVDFENIAADTAWESNMTKELTVSNYWPDAADITVREENGNKYLEFDKNTTAKGMVEFIKTADVPADEAFVFQTDIRHTHVSDTANCSYFQFYSYVDGAYKNSYSLTNAFFSVDSESGNVMICGSDSGVAEGEWFTLTMKFTTNTLEILVNGETLNTFTVDDIQNTAVIRVRSDAAMQHKTDFDNVYFGAEI